MPSPVISETLRGKSVCCLWLRQNGTGNQYECLSSIEYIFRATVSAGVIALVLGGAVDLISSQHLKTRVIILFELVSIHWSWDEASK